MRLAEQAKKYSHETLEGDERNEGRAHPAVAESNVAGNVDARPAPRNGRESRIVKNIRGLRRCLIT